MTLSATPKTTKGIHFHVPAPQRERIVKRFISGQSLRSISRDERRGRATVARIVDCSEVQKYVKDLKATYYGLGGEALDAVRRAIRVGTDGKIAYQLLADIGVVPNQDDRQRLSADAVTDDEETRVLLNIGQLIQAGAYRTTAYGMSPGAQVEEVIAMAGGAINRKTGAIEPIGMSQPARKSTKRRKVRR
jgi:hypothetical protein